MPDAIAIQPFFHPPTGTWSYIASRGSDAVVIDPVLDYDAGDGRTGTTAADVLLAHLDSQGLRLHYVLETHAHADHLSAAAYLTSRTGAQVAIGAGIRAVQAHFANGFGLRVDDPAFVDAFDRLLKDGDVLDAGELRIEVIATPGHTPDGLSYRMGNNVFVGDTLFAPDVGTARCDFPGGSVEQLHNAIQRLHALPDDTVLWLCHDYPPAGRAPRAWIPVAESRRDNTMAAARIAADAFHAARRARDATLSPPALLRPALQVNLRGGRLPAQDRR
ncbi:MBL fold metallo-hydrolase [Cognatiluteimonas telluris]|uniref:MBL fold metallo-hydrolase n=1 Tax=Cognatiluteimonas telluris TaxID=1104775 RepID=UPI00140A93C0|nr:MBL fold metallo-hydrolase [Lysobacter telluris]